MRLDKILAHCGLGSRKEVKNYIRKGYVTVNGTVIKKDDFKVNDTSDEITFDNQVIEYREFVYLMLHKPANYISATKDNVHPTVLELIEGYENYDLFPVGRLDIDTEGLLIVSNDGDFAHKLLAPSRNHAKLYYAKIKGIVTPKDIETFKKGIVIEEQYTCKPANLKIISTTVDHSEIEVEIFEGKFHQVKKMFLAINKEVEYLKRIKIRHLCLDSSLKKGEFRELTNEELVDLMMDL